jgi:hypothetical protein
LPTALCRLPRGFAVGKAFADWVYAFADRGKQSAKRRFPVVLGGPIRKQLWLPGSASRQVSGQVASLEGSGSFKECLVSNGHNRPQKARKCDSLKVLCLDQPFTRSDMGNLLTNPDRGPEPDTWAELQGSSFQALPELCLLTFVRLCQPLPVQCHAWDLTQHDKGSAHHLCQDRLPLK